MARSDFFIGMFVFGKVGSLPETCSVNRVWIDLWLVVETVHPRKSLTKLLSRRNAHGFD